MQFNWKYDETIIVFKDIIKMIEDMKKSRKLDKISEIELELDKFEYEPTKITNGVVRTHILETIKKDVGRITSGNLSHNLPSISGYLKGLIE